jgi:hypothetical protein
MHKRTLSIALSLLLLTLGVLAVPFAFAGDEAPEGDTMQKDMAAKHEQMMEHHQQMLDEMKAKQEKLASLVDAMNSAGDHGESIDAITAVLNELVAQHQARMGQHIEMMEQMGDMPMAHHGMKKGMKGHGHHGKKGCSHCKAGECPHHGGKSCSHCKAGGECPHKKAGEACPHCDGDGECPHCKGGGECMHHGHHGDCPMGEDCPHHEKMKDEMKDEPMEMEGGSMEEGL